MGRAIRWYGQSTAIRAAGECPSGAAEVLSGRVVMKTEASVVSHAGSNVALLRLW